MLARRRGVNARHQSLRATVAWSYDLLSDVEQSFFDELSAFGADFGVHAARAVGGDTTVPVDDLLMSLVDKSLLTANRGPLGMRFRQLETVRQYGEARLQGRGGVPASMRRQLDHYVEWTESADAGIKSPDELHWHQWFTSEWPNVRNVFRWACTVDDGDAACRLVSATLWWATSRMQLEADRWCELALGMPSAADHPLRPDMLAGASLFAHRRGDRDRDRRSLERARVEERRLGAVASPLVEVAALNEWNGGPAGAMRDVAALRLRAEHVSTSSGSWRPQSEKRRSLPPCSAAPHPRPTKKPTTSTASAKSSDRPRVSGSRAASRTHAPRWASRCDRPSQLPR